MVTTTEAIDRAKDYVLEAADKAKTVQQGVFINLLFVQFQKDMKSCFDDIDMSYLTLTTFRKTLEIFTNSLK